MNWLKKFAKIRLRSCKHEFYLDDLKRTEIPEPERPANGDGYEAHIKWHREIYTHPSYTERVEWACFKCGQIFRAHCGLDISPSKGDVRKRADSQV